MKFQEDLELREKVFRRVGGDFDSENVIELPPIETSWEVCAEYLVPFMRGKGFDYYIASATNLWGLSFVWCNSSGMKIIDCEQEIKNDNIARAACEAFMEAEL